MTVPTSSLAFFVPSSSYRRTLTPTEIVMASLPPQPEPNMLPELPSALPEVTRVRLFLRKSRNLAAILTSPLFPQFVHAPSPPPSTRRILLRFLRSQSGRDATLVRPSLRSSITDHTTDPLKPLQRLFQYTLRLVVYLRRRALPKSIGTRLLAIVSTVAAIRRLISLFSLLSALRLTHLTLKTLTFPTNDELLTLARSFLDTFAVLTDNLYLFSRLSLLPRSILSHRTALRVDKTSEILSLASAAFGLFTVSRRRKQVYHDGRAARKRAVLAEARLAEVEFWAGGKMSHRSREEKEEAEGLKETERRERRTLRGLHEELGELMWERARAATEGIFART